MRALGRAGELKASKIKARHPGTRPSKGARLARLVELSSLLGARKGALPNFIPPQLATLVDAAPGGDSWLREVKLDGYRLLARIDGAHIKLVTRRGNDWTDKFKPLVNALAKLKLRSAILDGEIVHLNPDGTSSFGALQEDLSEGRPDRLFYFLFDLLALDGFVLTGCKLEDRKRVLERVVARAPKGPIRYSDHVVGHGPEFYVSAPRLAAPRLLRRRWTPALRRARRNWLQRGEATRHS